MCVSGGRQSFASLQVVSLLPQHFVLPLSFYLTFSLPVYESVCGSQEKQCGRSQCRSVGVFILQPEDGQWNLWKEEYKDRFISMYSLDIIHCIIDITSNKDSCESCLWNIESEE